MSGVSVRVKFGNPSGVSDVEAKIRSGVILAVAQATVERVQARVNHPAADSLKAVATNQWSATVQSSRGGPGIIRPVRARALHFFWKGEERWFQKVNGVGLGPLIEAEGQRVDSIRIDQIKV